MTSDTKAVITRNHPIYWFKDGSLILDVEEQRFKVHHTLVSRHSRFLSSLTKRANVREKESNGGEYVGNVGGSSPNHDALKHIALDPQRQVRAEDVDALLQHLYHDMPLGKDSPLAHIASILRVSSPQQLDYPDLHKAARGLFEGMFPTNPGDFTHTHPRHEALPVATMFNLTSARKAILYSLVTMTEFDVSEEPTSTLDADSQGSTPSGINISSDPTSKEAHVSVDVDGGVETLPQPPSTESQPTSAVLTTEDARICMNLMMRLIEHFTPILFTPAATPHMNCTDIFAETWMPIIIQPAIDDDGVYKPLETLQRMKEIDWAKHGLCASCVIEKRAEWEDEQRTVWDLMDAWLEHDAI